jgi:hypothetical protein
MKGLEVVISWGLVIVAAVTIWAVVTPNHMYVG